MLWSLLVYCRRIKASPQRRRPKSTTTPSQSEDFSNLVIRSRSSVFDHDRAKIILLYLILHFFLPIMGHIQIGDEPPTKYRLPFRGTTRDILELGGEPNERFLQPDFLSDFDRNYAGADGMKNFRKRSGCLLCKITENINRPKDPARTLRSAAPNFESESMISDSKRDRRLYRKLVLRKKLVKQPRLARPSSTFSQNSEKSHLKTLVRKRRNTGDRRQRRLFCRTGYILQIHANGKVDGTYDHQSKFGVMTIQTVGKGMVSIKGEATGLFLAMSPSGKLSASAGYDRQLHAFDEMILDNWYNTYSKAGKRNRLYVGLSRHGRAKKGSRVSDASKTTHFLPLKIN